MAGQRMTTYILLRKNKEHGPFSFEDLKAREILPDDLFWMEGQSVCWLNPGEIKELKDLVGIPAQQKDGGFSAYLPPETAAEPEPLNGAGIGQAAWKPANTPALKKETSPVKSFDVTEERDPEAPETHYSKPLDEIKAIYLKNLERQQKRKHFPITIPPAVKKASPYAAFLVIGLLAGMLINKKGGKNKTGSITARQEIIAKPAVREPEQVLPDPGTLTVLPAPENAATVSTGREPELQEPLPEPSATPAKKVLLKKPVLMEPEQDNSTSVSKTDERTARSREAAQIPDPRPVKDLSSLVTVSANDYQVGSFGGIKNLQLTLKNESEFPIKQATAELRYYKPGDELLKTESYHFYSVPARGMQVIAVPKSARGVKVTCKLVRIESAD